MAEALFKVRIMVLNGMDMPFRVDFDSPEEFDQAVTEWNKYFREDFKW